MALTRNRRHTMASNLVVKAPDTPDTKIRVGRPAKYDERIVRIICRRLMRKETLSKICADPRMPSVHNVTNWLSNPKYKEFRERYYEARRVAAEMRVDEIFDIMDDTEDDWVETFDKNGEPNGWKPNHDAINRARLKIDTIKWYAGKMVPRIYGDNINVEHEATGDLADLLKAASNKSSGLPPAIDVPVEVVEDD